MHTNKYSTALLACHKIIIDYAYMVSILLWMIRHNLTFTLGTLQWKSSEGWLIESNFPSDRNLPFFLSFHLFF